MTDYKNISALGLEPRTVVGYEKNFNIVKFSDPFDAVSADALEKLLEQSVQSNMQGEKYFHLWPQKKCEHEPENIWRKSLNDSIPCLKCGTPLVAEWKEA